MNTLNTFVLYPLLLIAFLTSCGNPNTTAPNDAQEAGPTVSPEDVRSLKIEELNKELTITGKRLVIDEFDIQGLYKRLHGKSDLEKVTFDCDELVLSRSLSLPGTDVEITAKKMRTLREGQLILTPLPYKEAAKTLQDGLHGKPGRTLTLRLEEAKFHHTSKPIFVVTGGNGQQAGAGLNGEDGLSVHHKNGIIAAYSFSRGEPRLISGGRIEPTAGSKPQLPGKPGEPGHGGVIKTNLILNESVYNLSGGLPGLAADDVYSGKPGAPNPYHIVEDGQKFTQSLPEQTLYYAPKAQREKGEEGRLIYLEEGEQ